MELLLVIAFLLTPVGAIAAICLVVRLRRKRRPDQLPADHELVRPMVSTPVLAVLVVLGVLAVAVLWVIGSALARL